MGPYITTLYTRTIRMWPWDGLWMLGTKLGNQWSSLLVCISSFGLSCYTVSPSLLKNGVINSDGLPTTKKTFQISPNMPMMDTKALFWVKVADSIN
ncbi:UDP-glycosyltransferase 83A1, partial [Sesbania bispinosa]